ILVLKNGVKASEPEETTPAVKESEPKGNLPSDKKQTEVKKSDTLDGTNESTVSDTKESDMEAPDKQDNREGKTDNTQSSDNSAAEPKQDDTDADLKKDESIPETEPSAESSADKQETDDSPTESIKTDNVVVTEEEVDKQKTDDSAAESSDPGDGVVTEEEVVNAAEKDRTGADKPVDAADPVVETGATDTSIATEPSGDAADSEDLPGSGPSAVIEETADSADSEEAEEAVDPVNSSATDGTEIPSDTSVKEEPSDSESSALSKDTGDSIDSSAPEEEGNPEDSKPAEDTEKRESFEASEEEEPQGESQHSTEAPEEDKQEQSTAEEEPLPDGTGEVASEAKTENPESEIPDESQEGGTSDEDGAPGTDGEAAKQESGVTLPEEAEAWFKRHGQLQWGKLQDLLKTLAGKETVFIQSSAVLFVKAVPNALIAQISLIPDGSLYDGNYTVYCSLKDPSGTTKPEIIDPHTLEQVEGDSDLYIWVGKCETQPAPTTAPVEAAIAVTATDYSRATWSALRPEFTLSGIPEGKGWSYAAIIYDERIVPFSSDEFIPEEEGQYNLRFAELDELGDIMATSEQYILWLDWTAPEEVDIYVDEETSYTLHIEAVDNMSGVAAVSLNGGKKWHKLSNGETYTYRGKKEKTFYEGDILVKDAAGNIFACEETYELYAIEPEEGEEAEEGGGGGGGGEGSGTGTPKLSHASGDGEEGSEYDALLLELPDEPMDQLTVDGTPMELTLVLGSAERPEAPVGSQQFFTGSLRKWNRSGSYGAADADTLVLEAQSAGDLGDRFTYEWHFNGEVYRLLGNSGIKYVALKVGDDVAVFPTEGFTGGTRYTELKMDGVSTKHFDYTITMKVNLDPGYVSNMSDNDFSQSCDVSILAEVEGTRYELSSSANSIMYFYDVYLGPEDIMDRPFGEYR
ncbi:MAG: hypothetical protein IJH38_06760, partial [Clostridia bacterium]|nr:hypothetical protein [Clostridia bacterium]